MKLIRYPLLIGIFLLLTLTVSLSVPVLAQVCPVNLPQMLTRAVRACKDLERNTACYGNGDLSFGVMPLYDDPRTVFANSGDQLPIAAFAFLQTGAQPLTTETWGLATLNVQANLLAEQPARSSILWLFGDVTVNNLVPELPELTATATGTLNLRALPQADAEIIQQVKLREKVIANGRTQDNRWLRVLVPRTGILAWASLEVVELNRDIHTLEVVSVDTPFYRPFQVLELQTGTADSPCDGVSDSGLLIQTPNDIDAVEFTINGAKLKITGTVFIQAAPDLPLTINVLNGRTAAETGDSVQIAPAGARLLINAEASPAEPYIRADLDHLPLDILPFKFVLPDPLSPEGIELALNPPMTPTPPPAEPDLNPRCVRVLKRNATLRGGPGSFYESTGDLLQGTRVYAVYQSTDADGYTWWQIRSGRWLRADFVESTGDCDPVPLTTALTQPPGYNNLRLEACASDNGPIRAGQEVTITFNDGSFDSYDEARKAVRVGPARIKVGNKRLQISVSQPYLVSSDPERWYLTFSATWVATPGTVKIVANRRYLELSCNVTVPFGR